jgi:C1A family cysteine protease
MSEIIVPTQRENSRYGWKPDLPDSRDKNFRDTRAYRRGAQMKVPSKIDLRETEFEPPIYNQFYLGSCTAQGIAGAYQFEQRKQGLADYIPSRLFIYYEERRIINEINVDNGAYIRDGLKVVNKLGAPDERLWPYEPQRFASQPSAATYEDGQRHQALGYARVDYRIQRDLKIALMMKIPVVFGFSVQRWFDQIGPDGVAKIPADPGPVISGHCVELVGYERLPISRLVYAIWRNSWGESWGDRGYCYVPMRWQVADWNSDDYWVITEVEA